MQAQDMNRLSIYPCESKMTLNIVSLHYSLIIEMLQPCSGRRNFLRKTRALNQYIFFHATKIIDEVNKPGSRLWSIHA